MPNNLVAAHLYDPALLAVKDLVATLPPKQAAAVQELLDRFDRIETSAAEFAAEYLREQKDVIKMVEALEEWREFFDGWVDEDNSTPEDLITPSNNLYMKVESLDPPDRYYDVECDLVDRILGR